MTGLNKISKQFCYQELLPFILTTKNIHDILRLVGDKTWEKYKDVRGKERAIIIKMTKRFGSYLYETWDSEKKEGVKRTPEISLEYTTKFLKKNSPHKDTK